MLTMNDINITNMVLMLTCVRISGWRAVIVSIITGHHSLKCIVSRKHYAE